MKRKINPMLMNVLLISGAVHVVALFILGGITIVKFVIPDEAQFEEPSAAVVEEPPKEVKVEIRPQTAQVPDQMNQLRMKAPGNIAIDAVDINLPTMEQSFSVSSGLGGGFGGRGLLGGTSGRIGIGMSDISVFGLKSRAERVLFAIDASRTMMTDEKGGLNSYEVIKDEIVSMVSNLSAGTLFNVVFFDGSSLQFFKEQTVPAGSEVSQELRSWIDPINADYNNLGIRNQKLRDLTTFADHPIQAEIQGRANVWRNTEAYRLQLFLEQSVDAIFVIVPDHGGFPRIIRPPSPEDLEKAKNQQMDPELAEAWNRYRAAVNEARRVASAQLQKLNEQRKARGIPPKVIDGDILKEFDVPIKVPRPTSGSFQPEKRFHEPDQVEDYFDEVIKKLYGARGGSAPSINVIVFLAGDEAFSAQKEDAVKDFTRNFGGRHRLLRGLNEIRDAASAKQSTN